MTPFDSHFHLLPEAVYKNASFYNESWGDLSASIAALDGAGVERALVSYPTTDFHARKSISEMTGAREYNSALAGLTKQAGGRLEYLAYLPLTRPSEMLAEVTLAVAEGARGLSVPTNCGGLYPDDASLLPFFEQVERLGLPVVFHPTTQTPFGYKELRHPLITPVFQYSFDTAICLAKVIDCGLLNKFPKLTLVFASFGGVMPFLAGRFDRTYNMLLSRGIVGELGEDPGATLRRIYVDTSGTTSPSMLKLAVEVFGEDRVMWGSDFPANRDIAASIGAVKGCGLGDVAVEKILFENMQTVINA